MKSLLDSQLSDATAERVRRSHAEAIREIQAAPILPARVIRDVVLANGAEVDIAHGLGRRPAFVTFGPIRNAAASGRINEFRGTHSGGQPIDAAKVICLQAVGYGATVTIDVMVW